MAGVANDHFAPVVMAEFSSYSQPRLARKRVRSRKEKEKTLEENEANLDYIKANMYTSIAG